MLIPVTVDYKSPLLCIKEIPFSLNICIMNVSLSLSIFPYLSLSFSSIHFRSANSFNTNNSPHYQKLPFSIFFSCTSSLFHSLSKHLRNAHRRRTIEYSVQTKSPWPQKKKKKKYPPMKLWANRE